MSHYKTNLRDIEFNLFEVLGRDDVLGTGPFGEVDGESAREILREVERLSREDLAASYEDSDRNPPVFDPATHTAPVPESFKKSYQAWMDSEFWRLQVLEEMGGTPAPSSLIWAHRRDGARRQRARVDVRRRPGVRQRRPPQRQRARQAVAQHMVDRQWGCTMVLTEPDAGSDVGAGRAKAVANEDGSWNITGVKRFITSADARHEREHHAPRPRPPRGRRGRRRPRHQGPLALLDAGAPLRPRDRRADR